MTVPALFYGAFKLSATGLGATSLTVTVDVDRITKADGTKSNLVTAGAATTECRNGVYAYFLSGADFLLYDYVAVFKTAATTVVSKEVEAWRGGLAESMEQSYTAARAVKIDDILDVAVAGMDFASTASINSGNILGILGNPAGLSIAGDIIALASTVNVAAGQTNAINTTAARLASGLELDAGSYRWTAAALANVSIVLSSVYATEANATANKDEILVAIGDIDIAPNLVINSTAPELQTLAANGKLTIHRGDYTTFDLTLGSLVGRTGKKLIFTLKPKKDDLLDDSLAYLQITEVDGAVLVNGSSDGVEPTDASMAVLNEATGQTRFVIKGEIADLLPIGSNFWYDVQMIDSDGQPRTKTEDRAEVSRDVTRRSE